MRQGLQICCPDKRVKIVVEGESGPCSETEDDEFYDRIDDDECQRPHDARPHQTRRQTASLRTFDTGPRMTKGDLEDCHHALCSPQLMGRMKARPVRAAIERPTIMLGRLFSESIAPLLAHVLQIVQDIFGDDAVDLDLV